MIVQAQTVNCGLAPRSRLVAQGKRQLTEREIAAILRMYRPEAIRLRDATFEANHLTAVFDSFPHPFTCADSKHLTREHVLLFITQASYVFATCLCEARPDWGLSASRFLDLAMAEQTTFTRIDMRFRRFVRNHNGVLLHMRCAREHLFGDKLFLRFDFDLPDGCGGTCEGLIAKNGSLTVGETAFSQECQ